MSRSHRALLPAGLVLIAGIVSCRTGRNYDGQGPRYVGVVPSPVADTTANDTLLIVSFNVQYGERPDSAVVALRADTLPRRIDLLLAQEVDSTATDRIARALGLGYVYYPAIHRTRTRRDFGNAILSRWPIVDDAKIILPHRSWYGGSQRIATAATIRVGARSIRVYSAHLGTPADITAGQRRDQVLTVVDDAAKFERVIIGGDFNNGSAPGIIEQRGYLWATRDGPRTTALGRWDHILLKGFATPSAHASGTMVDNHNTSDHTAVWAVAILR